MSKDLVGSALCDELLLRSGPWDADCRNEFSDWIRSDDFEERRFKASRLIQFLIKHLLGEQMTIEGKIRAKALAESLIHLEDLLITARSGIGKKFYRDHLNHMLRVTLLANAIASKQERLMEHPELVHQLLLACLFHDIAYPLAESRAILGDAISAMERCYRAMTFPHLNYAYSNDKAKIFTSKLTTIGYEIPQLSNQVERFSHSVVAGIEFLDYVMDSDIFAPALEAIVLHDSEFETKVSFDSSPLLAILIIADEFQDWGRPVPFAKEALIAEIGNLEISENKVSGEFDFRRESPLSAFRQAWSKVRNLRRLNLTESGLNVRLRMVLPPYEIVELSEVERCIAEVWDSKYQDELKPFSDVPLELFMERYYGTSVSKNTRMSIIDALQSGTLISSSPLAKFICHLNLTRAELILVEKSIGCPRSIVLAATDDGHFQFHVEAEQSTSAELHGEPDPRWKVVAEYLAEELRIFNRLCSIKSRREEGTVYLPWLGDFFLPPESIRECLMTAGFESERLLFVEKLRHVRNAMSEGGLFVIERQSSKSD